MYFGDRLDLDSVIFEALRDEIIISINAALMLADKEGKEGEVSIKIKVSTETVRKYKEGRVSKEWTEPRFSWNVTRKVKENKIDHKGSSVPGWELRFDEDGRPYVVEANQQSSLFDDEKSPFDTKQPEIIEIKMLTAADEEEPEVEENADTEYDAAETTLEDYDGGIGRYSDGDGRD